MDLTYPKGVGGRGWEDFLSEIAGGVEALIPITQDSLGRAETSDFDDLLTWCAEIRRGLDRIEYVVRVVRPLAELDDQIAEHQSEIAAQEVADRLRLERERVARNKGAKK